jgi:hypothetical protein
MEINAHVALMLDAVRWPHRQAPPRQETWPTGAEHCSRVYCPSLFRGALLFNPSSFGGIGDAALPSVAARSRRRAPSETAQNSRNVTQRRQEKKLVCPCIRVKQFISPFLLKILVSSRDYIP